MQYEIEVGGRLRQVTVTRTGSTFAVAVDGRTHRVDVAQINAHILSLLVDDMSPQGATGSHEVVLAREAGRSELIVRVGDTPVALAVNGRRRSRRGDEAAHTGGGPQRLAAPMPGKIVRVLVAVGDVVAARQPVVVVEAMKMENELRAARDGAVAELHVREGQSVDAGALLIVIQ